MTGKNRGKPRRLFCELGTTAYAISVHIHVLRRKLQDLFSGDRFASKRSEKQYPVLVWKCSSEMIKQGPGIDPVLQQNKADNIRVACSRIDGLVVMPGESFSFWRLVGKTSRRNGFSAGRVLINGKLVAGLGGGLCNLANTLHILVMNSPMIITELHHHSDALAPDADGVRIPYSAGTSVHYNYLDLRFRNDEDSPVQIRCYTEGDMLIAELRSKKEFPTVYRIVEEDHHFRKEGNGNYYRISRIYRETIDRTTGEVLKRELKRDNRSRVMFDPLLIPSSQLRDD